jgi:steroid 5-alpha reductase family enzyme
MTAQILLISVFLVAFMTLAWAYQRHVNNAGWVDVFWTFGLGLAGIGGALYPISGSAGTTDRQILVAVMAAIWSLRLGLHLAVRVGGHDAEDVRYAGFRKDWGPKFQSRMFGFLMIQAVAAILLALCILLAADNPAPGIGLMDWAGALILAIAIGGEGIADAQLARFKADAGNKGKVCDAGLWGWSRHPNYFFEWLVWVAFAVMAIDVTGAYPWGWFAPIAPAFMYWLLVYVSGIPPLETLMLKSRGEAFVAYQASTSAFFPLPPRRRHSNPAKAAHP